MYYGFKDQPNIPEALQHAYAEWGFEYDLMQISFFISRERIMHTVGEEWHPGGKNCLFPCSVIPVQSATSTRFRPTE